MEFGQILLLVFTGIVAVSTAAAAILSWTNSSRTANLVAETRNMVSETRHLREAQTEPNVYVRADLDPLRLVIQNDGHGAAQDVNLEFKGDPLYVTSKEPIDEHSTITEGLAYLGAGESVLIPLGNPTPRIFSGMKGHRWTFKLSYQNTKGRQFRGSSTVDFDKFTDLIDWQR